MSSLRLVDAAMRYERERLRAAALRRSRAELYCERAEPTGGGIDEPPDAGGKIRCPNPTQERPCWKLYLQAGSPEGVTSERMPESEWCESCRQRERINREYRAAAKARGAALRALGAMARSKLRAALPAREEG